MTKKEKTKRLDCYSDFYTAATAYYKNSSGTTHLTFIKHGKRLLEELKEQKLLSRCDLVEEKLSKSDGYDKYLAEDILVLGSLVRS